MTTDSAGPFVPKLAPYQAEFIDRIAADMGPGSMHLLRAPAGSGKAFAAVQACTRLRREGRARRILVIAPRTAMVAQWSSRLTETGTSSAVVGRQELRELIERSEADGLPWPEGGYCVTLQFASRPLVRSRLQSVEWDIVIFDEVHFVGSGAGGDLVRNLLESHHPPAVLAFSDVQPRQLPALLDQAIVIDWRKPVEEHTRERRVESGVRITREEQTFRRSNAETAVAKATVELARWLGAEQGLPLLQRAAAGPIPLEHTLVKLLGTDDLDPALSTRLEEVLVMMDDVEADSQLACFLDLLTKLLGAGSRYIVVFSDFRGTADYLSAATERIDAPTFTISAAESAQRAHELFSEFRSTGGLLIITTAASQGLPLPFVDTVVHYDLTLQSFGLREERYNQLSREGSCRVFFLVDTSDSLPIDRVTRELVERSLDGDEKADLDPQTIFRAAAGDPAPLLDLAGADLLADLDALIAGPPKTAPVAVSQTGKKPWEPDWTNAQVDETPTQPEKVHVRYSPADDEPEDG